MKSLLLDTGPLVALLDRSDGAHGSCVEALRSVSGRMLTTEPVVTESLWLLDHSLAAQKACVELLLAADVKIIGQTSDTLKRAIVLMEKYHNVPMDYADATLVVLAENEGVADIFTLDKRGFEVYRFNGKHRFSIVPGRVT